MSQIVEMYLLHGGSPRDLQAREELAAALPDAELTEPDDVGVFEIHLEADDKERRSRASGTPSRPPAPTTTSSSSNTPTSRSTGSASPEAPPRSFDRGRGQARNGGVPERRRPRRSGAFAHTRVA